MLKLMIKDPEQLAAMDEEYREALTHQMLAHCEGELVGVKDYLDVMVIAPTAEEKKYCLEGARDEMQHYIVSAKVLADIGIDTRYMLDEGPDDRRFYPQEVLNLKTTLTWPERGLTSFLAERAALDIIEEMAESSYEPWAAIMPAIITEESTHVEHGRRITSQFCNTEEGLREMQEALQRIWPQSLDMFGASKSRRSALAVRCGIRLRTNEEARQHFSTRARTMLAELGLTPPADHLNRKFV